MTLQVIGSGFGRTGTLTLKGALERLGLEKCHHMLEVFNNPDSMPLWMSAARGEAADWDAIFAGYRAQVDWPGCHFWRALAKKYPEAKVVHSVRSSPEVWCESFSKTIGETLGDTPPEGHPLRDWLITVRRIVIDETFGGRLDRQSAIDAYRRREDEVRREISPERLLVYNVAEGWAPLCEFLGVPVPDEPMPVTNTTEDFRAHMAARRAQ